MNDQATADDQELAKVLAGVSQESAAMQFEETAAPAGIAPLQQPSTDPIGSAPVAPIGAPTDTPMGMPTPMVTPTTVPSAAASAVNDAALNSIKQAALSELRPLVGKLDVSPEEKFDTYLLLLRSTDDRDLIAPAHEAAKAIADEARRAQALLDIIKEIDFLSQK
ncbi:MAG: hypothetical protein Q4A34_03675 [Candidatus Saccharibacteria bacterium]|nr:hypothetical protein [Candidatus Saccharibacteria bacterium]